MCRSGWFLQILLILTLARHFKAQESKSSAPDFNKRNVVKPVVYHGLTKREILSTKDISDHHSEIQVEVPVGNELYVLELELNHDLVTENHTLLYQEGGRTVKHTPRKEELNLCHYVGTVKGKPNSWVALSTCHGIRGAIFDGETVKYIEPAQNPKLQSLHYLYDQKDLDTNYGFGHYDGIMVNDILYDELIKHQDVEKTPIIRHKRELKERVQSPYQANKDSRYVELVLVVDHGEFLASGGNLSTVHSQMIQLANIVSSLFSQLNIYIALVGVVVWNERDEIRLGESGDKTLENFLEYRRRKLASYIPNDNAHLLTKQKFSDGVVSKALKGTICTFVYSGGVFTNHSTVLGALAATVAHGIGRNFGMEHDTENCACPDEKCIMSGSYSSAVAVHWSSCSSDYLARAFERGLDYCLHNKPKRLFNSPTCGNGFIEAGEQCDCGTTAFGGDVNCHVCCDPDKCTLRANATCGSGSCCDLATCRLKPMGVVCRTAERECDLPEFCSGRSEFCPADVYRMDSTPCGVGENQAYCVRGACRSHNDQCRLLWGAKSESSHPICYDHNRRGVRNGNCGYDRINGTYTQCSSDDLLCGLVQCRWDQDTQLAFGMEALVVQSVTFLKRNGSIIPCTIAMLDVGLNDVDPGYVPDGAKCGLERMCLKQKCVSIEEVRQVIKDGETSVCPSDCSRHGVCNSEGHCHCDQGFAPPLCLTPGVGGSIDSGPAADLVRLSDLAAN